MQRQHSSKDTLFPAGSFFSETEDKVRGYNSLQHIRKMIDNDTWFLCPISLTRGIYKTSSSALWETGVLHNNRSTEPMHRKTNTVWDQRCLLTSLKCKRGLLVFLCVGIAMSYFQRVFLFGRKVHLYLRDLNKNLHFKHFFWRF